MLNGKTLYIKFATNAGPTSFLSEDVVSEKQLFVTGLPVTATHATIRTLFREYPVVDAKVAFDGTGNCKGHGWVAFGSHDAAKTAKEAMDGFMLPNGVKLRVDFSRIAKGQRELDPNRNLLPTNSEPTYPGWS
jgi:RNA recognition motif-containing protein